jgi:hypothetical protein
MGRHDGILREVNSGELAAGDRDWKKYEEQIYNALCEMADGNAQIEFDASLPGRFSKVNRQVDVRVKASFGNLTDATMAVDCKCYSRRVDVKDVETFMGLVDDVQTDFGLLVTTAGYTEAAKNRADAPGIRIEIVPYEELAEWEPPFRFCEVCTDWSSDHMPGGVYIEPWIQGHEPPGGELAVGAGTCDRCQAVYMECKYGTVNHSVEGEEGQWLECESACGVEWKTEIEIDRKGIPLTSDPHQQVEFRRR